MKKYVKPYPLYHKGLWRKFDNMYAASNSEIISISLFAFVFAIIPSSIYLVATGDKNAWFVIFIAGLYFLAGVPYMVNQVLMEIRFRVKNRVWFVEYSDLSGKNDKEYVHDTNN